MTTQIKKFQKSSKCFGEINKTCEKRCYRYSAGNSEA